MKKSFTFFAISALFLMLLFPASLKAADTVLKFSWTTTENHDSKNWPADADFSYSGPVDEGCKYWDTDWAGVSSGITMTSSDTYSLKEGENYTFTLRVKWKENANHSVPKIQLNSEDFFTRDAQSFTDGTVYDLTYSISVPADGDYTIKVITQDGERDKFGVSTLTIPEAAIAPAAPTYAVSATASNGSVSGTGSYTEGAEVTLTASPNENYSFTGWSSSDISIANASANPLVFSMPAKAVSVTATFAACTKHTVTLTAGANGSVSGGGEQCDGSVTVTATPNTGYRFVNWTNTLTSAEVSTNAVYTFDLSADISLTANFEVDPCSNSLTIQCEDYVNYDTKPSGSNDNKPSGLVKEDHTGYGTPEGGYYADFKTSTGEMWIPITLPAGTFTFTVRYVKGGGNMWFNLYDVANSSKIDNSKKLANKGDSWDTDESNSYTLSGGDYVIGIYSEEQYTGLDQITITATSNVFCPTYDITMENNMGGAAPTADKVKAEENASVSISAAETIGEFTFTGWTATAGSFDDASAASTTFTMPAEAVTITANYNTYSRTGAPIAAGNYGTICLPLNGTVTGATLYSVAGKETGDISYLVLEDKGTSLEAGKPYIFQLSADVLSVALSGIYTDVQDGNGLVGRYETINLTPYAEPSTLNYVLNENAFKKAGTGVTVGAYRAYLNWDAVSAAPAPAQSARRIRMVIEGKEVQTGMETVTAMPKTTKVLIDGQLYIIREGKRYTLTGARAQ